VGGATETTFDGVPAESFWRVLREPAIPIILTTLVVHLARRNGADIVVFTLAVLVILFDRWWSRAPNLSPSVTTWLGDLGLRAILVGAVGYAGVLAAFPRDGWVTMVGLAIPGLVALTWVLRQPDSPLSAAGSAAGPPASGWWWWPLLAVAMCLWELSSFLQQPNSQTDSFAHPTMSSVIDPLLSDPVARAGVIVGWILLGVWLVRSILVTPRSRERDRLEEVRR
jgi:hypothetical protein